MFLITAALLLVLAGILYLYFTWTFDYWKKRGVGGPKPWPLVGNYPKSYMQQKHMAEEMQEHYRAFKGTHDFVGLFSGRSPQLLVTSPALAHRVFVNDFKNFHDNEAFQLEDTNDDNIFAKNPFMLTGEEWKERRAEVTPGLTLARVKTAFPVTTKICNIMCQYINRTARVPPKEGLDAKDLSLRFTSQVVTDCVLGLNAESFTSNPTPIFDMTKKLFEQSFGVILYLMVVNVFPFVKKIYKARFIPKHVEDFFVDLMQSAIKIRRLQSDKDRTDFMNYILSLQDKMNMSVPDVTSHAMTFLVDGFETTASVLSHCLLMLGRNPEAQEILRYEVVNNFGRSGELDFDKLIELPYLDACIHETIRIFSPGLFSTKLCTEPIDWTNKDGSRLKVEKNTAVVVPSYALMMDEEYYPDPQKFQPERFLPENGGVKKYREMGLYWGFGDGPRVCPGMRFAMVQIKAAVATIIRNFDVKVNPKTRQDNQLDPTFFMARLNGGVYLDFEERF